MVCLFILLRLELQKITHKHTPSINHNYIKPHIMTMLHVPTTWRRSNKHKYGRNNIVTAPHV